MLPKAKRTLILLTILFGVLMSVPFLVPHTGFLALFGLVPLLFMEIVAYSGNVKRLWIWYYSAFVLWNAITTFWVCNATVGGGIFAVLANSFQMALVFAIYRGVKKKYDNWLAYVFLAAMWIAWERFYFDAEISWPWLVLGNSLARSTELAQWYEYTGVLGGSLWIWASNILVFYLLLYLLGGHFSKIKAASRGALITATILVISLPIVASVVIGLNYKERSIRTMDVLIGQPNFDPYQKFQSLSQAQQTAIYLNLIDSTMAKRNPDAPVLVLAPETFTNDVILGHIDEGATYQRLKSYLSNYPSAQILFGASSYEYKYSDDAPSLTARKIKDGMWYEAHNSAVMLYPTGHTEIFHKSKLVVGTELTPYPKIFAKIDDKLGGVMGRDSGQDEISLLHMAGRPIGCAVCYESVYGEYCTGYVKKGAEALTVITNDAWWGNTPGYKQHLSYSCLRAIETRRDIARCANTGISAIIDQKGRILAKTDWWQPAVLSGKINLNDAQTFYVKHGDIVGRLCTLVFLAMMLIVMVRLYFKK